MSTITITGSSFLPDAMIELNYPEIPPEYVDAVLCSIITISADGKQVVCLPYLPNYPDDDVNVNLYELMLELVEYEVFSVRLLATVTQQRGLEATHTSTQVATYILPQLASCSSNCGSTITSATQVTLVGSRLGTDASQIAVVFRPSGHCVPIAVSGTSVTCKIQGVLLEGPLFAAVFLGKQPESLEYWIS